ncbi:MAG: stage II sporulation protein R [Clostridia bacterium]|nr:stage II sporulation protein R [Clostridia bacterium]
MNYRKSFFIFFLSIIILFSLYIYSLAKSYSNYVFNGISDSFIRFHVIANSNSTEDQILKYEIRDAIMSYISPLLANVQNKEDALQIIDKNIPQMYNISSKILSLKNMNYSIKISLGKSKFPTKDYSEFILPEGIYDALKIEIGKANGQNWWCVMFPSICIPQQDIVNLNQKTTSILENSLNSEELSIISKDTSTTDIKIKFKIIEIFENL